MDNQEIKKIKIKHKDFMEQTEKLLNSTKLPDFEVDEDNEWREEEEAQSYNESEYSECTLRLADDKEQQLFVNAYNKGLSQAIVDLARKKEDIIYDNYLKNTTQLERIMEKYYD